MRGSFDVFTRLNNEFSELEDVLNDCIYSSCGYRVDALSSFFNAKLEKFLPQHISRRVSDLLTTAVLSAVLLYIPFSYFLNIFLFLRAIQAPLPYIRLIEQTELGQRIVTLLTKLKEQIEPWKENINIVFDSIFK